MSAAWRHLVGSTNHTRAALGLTAGVQADCRVTPKADPCIVQSNTFEFPPCPCVERQRCLKVVTLHILRFEIGPSP